MQNCILHICIRILQYCLLQQRHFFVMYVGREIALNSQISAAATTKRVTENLGISLSKILSPRKTYSTSYVA